MHPMFAKCGRSMWKRRRSRESPLLSILKSALRDGWRRWGVESGCIWNPCVALRCALVMVSTRSGAARVRGDSMPSPPSESPSWLMRIDRSGKSLHRRRRERKDCIIESVAAVRGPFHSSHGGSSMSVGRWYKMSDESKCGIFWIMHCEYSRNFVCSSSIEL